METNVDTQTAGKSHKPISMKGQQTNKHEDILMKRQKHQHNSNTCIERQRKKDLHVNIYFPGLKS
jgi:hypothetical protein